MVTPKDVKTEEMMVFKSWVGIINTKEKAIAP